MTQIVIGKHTRRHGPPDRHRANTDAGIVAPLGDYLGIRSESIYGVPGRQDGRGWFHRETAAMSLSRVNTAENATRLVGQKHELSIGPHAHLDGVLFADDLGSPKAPANLHSLY